MRSAVLLAAATVALVTAPAAPAEVRSGVSDGSGAVSLLYNGDGGALTITVAGAAPLLDARLATYCSAYPAPSTSAGAEQVVLLSVGPGGATATGGEGVSASATPAADGTALRVTLSDPALAGRDFRCLEGTVDGVPVLLYFNGQRFVKMTAASAEEALAAELTSVYGPPAELQTVYRRCPAARLAETALCRYQMGRGGQVRVGTAVVDETEAGLSVTLVRTLEYSQVAVRCKSRQFSGDRQFGSVVLRGMRLVAPKPLCDAALPATLRRRSIDAVPGRAGTVVLNQTPAKGFEPLSRYRCVPRAVVRDSSVQYRWRCANSLSDVVTFAFTAERAS